MWLFLFLFVFVYDDILTQTYTIHKHTYQHIQYIERHITSIRITSMSTRCNKPKYINITKHVVFFHLYCYTMNYMHYVSLSFVNLVYHWQRLLLLCCCWFVVVTIYTYMLWLYFEGNTRYNHVLFMKLNFPQKVALVKSIFPDKCFKYKTKKAIDDLVYLQMFIAT